jgi:hypothetical protein
MWRNDGDKARNMPGDEDTRVIGYFAYTPPMNVVCDRDACVVAGSEAALKRYIQSMGAKAAVSETIKKTRFGEIMKGLQLGGAYAFDEEAYNRFYPLASKAGLGLGAEDFSQPPPTNMHFVRVQLKDAS